MELVMSGKVSSSVAERTSQEWEVWSHKSCL